MKEEYKAPFVAILTIFMSLIVGAIFYLLLENFDFAFMSFGITMLILVVLIYVLLEEENEN